MTKKEYIRNSMIYTGQENVSLCIKYIEETLSSVTNNTINLINSKIIEPSAGNGSFYDALKYYDIVSYDTSPSLEFTKCIKEDFLNVEDIPTNKKYKIFLGFPPTRGHVKFIKHSFELGADVIAFIMPINAVNKKNLKVYTDNGYSVVFNKPVISNDFTLPDKEK